MRNCNISGLLGQPVQIHYVLLHPDVGMALLDIAPAVTPDAEAILRQRLAAVRFDAIFQGYLPIVYRSILPGEVSAIDEILAEAFAALPPLTLAGGDAWVTVMQRALSPRDPTRAAAPSAPPAPRPAWQARPPQAEPPVRPAAEMPVRRIEPEAEIPPAATPEEDLSPPADDADDPDAMALPPPPPAARRPRRGGWLVIGLGAAIAISALAAVLSRGDRPAATTEAAAPAAQASATAPLPDVAPGQPSTGAVEGSPVAPAAPRIAESPPGPAAPSGSEAPPAAPAQAGTPSVAAVTPAPQPAPPPAPPAPARGSTAPANAPPPPARPAPAAQEAVPQVMVRSPANLRQGPGNNYTVLRVTRRGETFRVHGRALGGWVEVGDDQPQGWIHSSLLTELSP